MATVASIRAAVQQAIRAGGIMPHQLAALSALDEALTPEQRQRFTEDWRAVGSPAAFVTPEAPAAPG